MKKRITLLNERHISFVHLLKSEPSAVSVNGFNAPPEYEMVVKHVTRLINLVPNISYVYSVDDEDIALITAEYNHTDNIIRKFSINVLEDWQNRKLGTEFIKSYFERIQTQLAEFKCVEVTVKEHNLASINAFLRAGCDLVGTEQDDNVLLTYRNSKS